MSMDGSQLFSNDRVILGVAFAQGGRDYMQDAYSINLNTHAKKDEIAFMGVFDGHGPNGENIARFIAYNISEQVLDQYTNGQSFPQSIETACLLLDDRMRLTKKLMDTDGLVLGGTTCNAVWIKGKKIYSCNVGDSRFIVAYNEKAVPITEDHKPHLQSERVRIYQAGGHISDGRVNGILAVARSFGDYMLKEDNDKESHEQKITSLPDVRTVDIDSSIDFMVLATDGIWDMMTNQETVDFIIERMHKTVSLDRIGEELIDNCRIPVDPATGLGADNMTVIIAVLK